MTNKKFDLVVIGAGASGASVAYEASRRGLKVALLEAGDISGGTSCRSTKLLHGGVRYLELAFKTFDVAQLKLVQEALLERAYWLEKVPFLANRLELAIPSKNCLDKAYFRLGLGIYDTLSGKKGIGSSRILSAEKLKAALPLLKDNSSGGIAYSDGQFNDARLNILLALTAEKAGAIIRNYCPVIGFKIGSNGKINGVISQDSEGQHEYWETNAVVNATGINSDKVRRMADKSIEPRILSSRGVHLVLENNLCPQGIGLLLPSTDDGRVIFVLPFFGHTLIGTTDTPCKVEDSYKPTILEREYLTSHLQRWFPLLKEPLIKSSWAGGRPLIKPKESFSNSSRVVREHEVETLPCGLISAMGGKWTTCRPIALDTLHALEKLLEKPLPEAQTMPLIGTDKDPKQTRYLLIKQMNELKKFLPNTPLLEKQLIHLQGNYGLEAFDLVSKNSYDHLLPLSEVVPICKAEIIHSINNEHAHTPTDVLARRCRLAMIDFKEAQRLLPIVQEELINAALPPGELNLEQ